MAKTSNWKNVERKLSSLFGGLRVPICGRTRGSEPDIKVTDGIFNVLSFEVKHRKVFPKWLHEAFDQALASIRGNQFAAVLLHQERTKYEESYIVMQVKDFITYSNLISSFEDIKYYVIRGKFTGEVVGKCTSQGLKNINIDEEYVEEIDEKNYNSEN
ncbi:MAG TPA: hypothetical protein PLP33_27680 [Leptospiraceae bacterium]|nr:hypothetical protein [Leptospiraceae bacterium]